MEPYDYAVVKYVHDPAAGECLNIGIVLFAPGQSFLRVKFDHKYQRLSDAFSGFDGEHYRRFIYRIESVVEKLSKEIVAGGLFEKTFELRPLLHEIFPDTGMSFQTGPIMAGITHDAEAEVEHIFSRLVTSQYEKEQVSNRDDEAVWDVFRAPLKKYHILERLQPKTFNAGDLEYAFSRAFKNERWHVLQSASFDYVRADSLKDKATTYLGIGTALARNSEMGKLYLLLGRPTRGAHLKQYESAKRLLSDHLQIDHELVEEDSAEQLAASVAEVMKQHPSD
jgi:hypothetical protein